MAKSQPRNNKNILAGIATSAPIGAFLGWIVLDNIGLGATIGTALGAFIGATVGEYRKKAIEPFEVQAGSVNPIAHT